MIEKLNSIAIFLIGISVIIFVGNFCFVAVRVRKNERSKVHSSTMTTGYSYPDGWVNDKIKRLQGENISLRKDNAAKSEKIKSLESKILSQDFAYNLTKSGNDLALTVRGIKIKELEKQNESLRKQLAEKEFDCSVKDTLLALMNVEQINKKPEPTNEDCISAIEKQLKDNGFGDGSEMKVESKGEIEFWFMTKDGILSCPCVEKGFRKIKPEELYSKEILDEHYPDKKHKKRVAPKPKK